MKPLSLFWNIRSIIYHVRAFLKQLPKNIPAILTICDVDVDVVTLTYITF